MVGDITSSEGKRVSTLYTVLDVSGVPKPLSEFIHNVRTDANALLDVDEDVGAV
jgi:hypothetical protein